MDPDLDLTFYGDTLWGLGMKSPTSVGALLYMQAQ